MSFTHQRTAQRDNTHAIEGSGTNSPKMRGFNTSSA